MKKLLSVLITIFMAMGVFAGCSQKTTTTPTNNATQPASKVKEPKDTLVAFSISNTANDFMANLVKEVGNRFKNAGYKFESASADANAQKQIEQIENFITMGADLIIVMAVEPTSLTDVCKKAMEKGTKIFAFTTDTKAYTSFKGANQHKVGESIANIGSKWVDKAFASAGNGAVNAVIFSYSGTPEAAERSKALATIAEKNKKVKITKIVEMENTTDAAMKAAENLAQTNPETNLILTYNGAMAVGVNSYVMSPGSIIKDKSKFGVIGSDLTKEFVALIEASGKDQSVFRGTALLGGKITDTYNDVFNQSVKILKNEKFEVMDWARVDEVDVDSVANFK